MSATVKYLIKSLFLIFVICIHATTAKGAFCVTTGNGVWTNSATWACGSVPTCGDSVVILSGHTVSITSADYTSCVPKLVIVIKGTLQFTAPGKLEMSCTGKAYVFTGGKIIPALGSTGNANAFQQCGSTWWNASAGTYNGPGCLPPTTPGCASTLPVQLVSFDGWVCGSFICLQWQTMAEYNNLYFQIEHSSDGVYFNDLERVNSRNITGVTRVSYTLSDNAPSKGVNYYRIKQVDVDGSFEYYPMIAVEYKNENNVFYLYPNPNSGFFKIEWGEAVYGDMSVLITDPYGREVDRNVKKIEENQRAFEFESAVHLSPGVYFCTIQSGKRIQIIKILVQ